jgi:hypothetical protein
MARKSKIIIPYTDGLEYFIPEPERDEDIINFDIKSKKDQFWKRPPIPNFKLMTNEEKDEYFIRELKRSTQGAHFLNNGKVEFLAPVHYWFLNHWDLGGGRYPDFYKWHQYLGWFMHKCRMDEDCFGGLVLTSKRAGKALCIETDIPTTKGWKKMKDIHVGDIVFGLDGKETKVIHETDIQYNRDCYEITFFDGSKIVADAEHKWIVSNYRDRARVVAKWNKKPLNTQVKTTLELLETQKNKFGNNNWTIKNTAPVYYKQKDLKIPPYILGIWLGDGSTYYTKLTNIDEEIIKEWCDYAYSIGMNVVKDSKYTYMITSGRKSGRPKSGSNIFLSNLQNYDLIKNKHIPIDYLTSSIEDRIDLLRGMMDTDGCKTKSKTKNRGYEYCTKLESLADNFCELLSSLGFKASKTKKYNKKVEKYYYYVRFSGSHINPFKLKRKSDLVVSGDKGGIKSAYRYISSIVKVDSVPVKCIQVDNETHSYLCTKKYIVTHNSEFIPCEFQVDAMTQTKAEYIIQAQNDIKAKKLFRRSTAAFYSLKRSLPYLYSYYTTKNEIMFKNVGEAKKTSTKKSSAKDIEEDFAVSDHVAIGAYPSKIDFVQGEATRGYFLDEFCSQELMDLQELHLKVLAQCSKGIGSKIIGKAWWVATPENAESKALSYSEQMWRDSDIAKRDKNGRTASGLYRMLVPYYASTPDFIDKYGYSDEDAAKEFFKNKCEGKSQSVINTLRRQYIASEDDAFIPIQSESLEQDVVEILVEQDKILTNHKLEIPYQYCFLYEENGEIKKSQKSVSINNTEEQDKWVEISEDPQPNVTYIIGVDGTNTDKMTSENGDKKSKYAIVVLKLFEHIDKINYTDVCNYSVVPDKMENLTKMVYAITMHYNKFGRASVMAEGNVGVGAAIVSYFDNKGMLKLIRKQPKIFGTDTREVKNRYTVYADEHVNRETLRLANLWCRRHGKNFRSRRLVKAILKIGSGNSDLGSAFRVALLGCGNFDPETIKKKEVPVARKRRQVLTYVNGTYMYTYV